MINDKKEKEIFKDVELEMQKDQIKYSSSQHEAYFNEQVNQSLFSIIDLFNFLSSSISYNNIEELEAILIDISKKIDAGTNILIPANSFEPLLLILDKYTNYSFSIIDGVLRIIYMLITISTPKKYEYFQFFSQPTFFNYYLNLFGININSIRITTEIFRKKKQIFENYEDQISFLIFQSPPSEPLINLLARCLKINPKFAPIDQVSFKLDEIMKFDLKGSLFCSAAELARHIIKNYDRSVSFFASNSIYYLKSVNDEIDNISLLKVYIEIVKITKDFSFLFIDSSNIFINFLQSVLNSCKSKDSIIPTLFDLLSYEANISCFLEFPQIMVLSLQKINIFPYNEQKKLMYFISNFVLNGNKQLLEKVVKDGILDFLSIFMSVCKDTKLTLKMLYITGLICENQIFISNQYDICECIETFLNSENDEIANMATAILRKITETEDLNC